MTPTNVLLAVMLAASPAAAGTDLFRGKTARVECTADVIFRVGLDKYISLRSMDLLKGPPSVSAPAGLMARVVSVDVREEKVINTATIQGVFSTNFQITGLGAAEARELALLLRAGALAAPLFVVEERAVGPSLGQDNIDKGIRALLIGMALLFVFMIVYYKMFGLVANLVLLANVVLLTALLSMLRATLSLPGIAGIILTVGIAVDANVLIYERIREELRNGITPQAAIRTGFEKAFSAILDSNVTALIAGIVLWVVGRGAIRGFAVVLTLGIATSMFTSLLGSRALITLMYGGKRRVERLSIG